MKTKLTLKLIAAGLLLSTLNPRLSTCLAQGTSFTYQGRLLDTGSPASGNYDLRFYLRDALSGGNPVGGTNNLAPVAVNSGLFTVVLDFGSGIFTGAARWLEIAVRTNGSVSAYTVISPREALTAVPYAITAGNLNGTLPASQLSGTLPSAQFSGTYSGAVALSNPGNSFSGNGSGLTGVNATSLNGYAYCALPCYWNLTGNAGTVPGVDFIGTSDNQPLTFKVNNTPALQISPGVTVPNVVGGLAAFRPSVIASGVSGAVIAGGNAPSGGVNGYGGGDFQAVFDDDGTVGGGFGNKVGSDDGDTTDAAFATVAGGVFNSATSYAAAVGGGDSNLAGGARAAVGGGYANSATADLSFIGGGLLNSIQPGADRSTIAGGELNVIKGATAYATIGGGHANTIESNSVHTTIAGGYRNQMQTNAPFSTIGGGGSNLITSLDSTYALPGPMIGTTIAGGYQNTISNRGQFATIGGGYQNASSEWHATIAGGYQNIARGPSDTIGGGYQNTTTVMGWATIAGGFQNSAGQTGATVGGGANNTSSAVESTVGGGYSNFATNSTATVSGGRYNTAGGLDSIIPGGAANAALGRNSMAAGYRAKALHEGCFVWADLQEADFASTVADQVSFRCFGGVRFTSGSGSANQTVSWTPGSASWSFSSDRELKDTIEPVNGRAVLEKVARLPISEWSYKGYSQRHIGAMAQDFHEAFPLNESTTTLNDADLHGVALAAIQGLNEKVREKDAKISELEKRLSDLERMVHSLAGKN